MNAKNTIKKIMADGKENGSALARFMGISRQGLHSMLGSGNKDVKVTTLVKMAQFLDYDVMLVPKSASDKVKGYIVGLEEE